MSYHILVIEDDEMNVDMIAERLELRGYHVLTAGDGLLGIDLARTEGPDLILMDVSLPEVDGWEATRRLKAEAATCHIPVIALTAHAMEGDREKAMRAGCDGYETKPVDFHRLLSTMESLLRQEVC
jgi:two-component system, cell cycle response regulator DivK